MLSLLDRVAYFLQVSSAWMAEKLFDILGVPIIRQGFLFHLPNLTIEVAKECGGINSAVAFFLLGLVVARLYIQGFSKRAAFMVCGFGIMIFKNALRIMTLTLLAAYVNPDFLTGNLHRHGGIVFFLLAWLMLLPVLFLLQRLEVTRREPGQPKQSVHRA
jgi:exosortase